MSRVFARWETMADGLTVALGEAGEGVYAFHDDDDAMDRHYADKPSRRRVRFDLQPGSVIVDLRKREHVTAIAAIAAEIGAGFKVRLGNLERAYWSITTYMERNRPDCAAFIVPHFTPRTRSCQIVARRPEMIREL